MIGLLIGWIVGILFFFVILYNVIQAAIDNSKLAKDVRTLKKLLSGTDKEDISDESDDATYADCPSCGHRVALNGTDCSECGLRLG
ncbi:hypothetical protein ACFPPD_04485 [Cohnella suwonensis]|uniref:Zinc ribbon domain-containing protein n=1 Tax=Cohnella suwonensis TaxID=696072 RepID=A0ABW0LRP0_9BACL